MIYRKAFFVLDEYNTKYEFTDSQKKETSEKSEYCLKSTKILESSTPTCSKKHLGLKDLFEDSLKISDSKVDESLENQRFKMDRIELDLDDMEEVESLMDIELGERKSSTLKPQLVTSDQRKNILSMNLRMLSTKFSMLIHEL